MKFVTEWQVRFAHCDAAGIVFYPRYFEMLNNLVEDWCEQGLGVSFSELHMVRGIGLPTVHLSTDFKQACKLGERLRGELIVEKIGIASFNLRVKFIGTDENVRIEVNMVLCSMGMNTRRAIPIPPFLRQRLEGYVVDAGSEGQEK